MKDLWRYPAACYDPFRWMMAANSANLYGELWYSHRAALVSSQHEAQLRHAACHNEADLSSAFLPMRPRFGIPSAFSVVKPAATTVLPPSDYGKR